MQDDADEAEDEQSADDRAGKFQPSAYPGTFQRIAYRQKSDEVLPRGIGVERPMDKQPVVYDLQYAASLFEMRRVRVNGEIGVEAARTRRHGADDRAILVGDNRSLKIGVQSQGV